MKNNLFPVGDPIYFRGAENLSNIFGLVNCKIKSPDYLFSPILLTRIGLNTIAPLGC
jgi:hypothetical protein